MVEEKLTGTHEPERGIYEPAYQAELKKRATELTGHFAEALKRSPEFTKALADSYWDKVKQSKYHEGFRFGTSEDSLRSVTFEKGDYSYEVDYYVNSHGDRFSIGKRPLNGSDEPRDLGLERIILGTGTVHNMHGFIQYVKYGSNGKEEEKHTYTPLAIQRVEEFLTTNFNVQLSQSQPERKQGEESQQASDKPDQGRVVYHPSEDRARLLRFD